jgi:hypothetical protein
LDLIGAKYREVIVSQSIQTSPLLISGGIRHT